MPEPHTKTKAMKKQETPEKTYRFTITGKGKLPVYHQEGFISKEHASFVGLMVVRKAFPGHRLVVTPES